MGSVEVQYRQPQVLSAGQTLKYDFLLPSERQNRTSVALKQQNQCETASGMHATTEVNPLGSSLGSATYPLHANDDVGQADHCSTILQWQNGAHAVHPMCPLNLRRSFGLRCCTNFANFEFSTNRALVSMHVDSGTCSS